MKEITIRNNGTLFPMYVDGKRVLPFSVLLDGVEVAISQIFADIDEEGHAYIAIEQGGQKLVYCHDEGSFTPMGDDDDEHVVCYVKGQGET